MEEYQAIPEKITPVSSQANDPSEPVLQETTNDEDQPQPERIAFTQPASENMEVHHHPDLHHKRKNFREYFLEFLMIFLAVTLGFFAENIRENYSEHQHAKELAGSLMTDLQFDTSKLSWTIAQRQLNTLKNDSLIKELDKPQKDQDIKQLQLWSANLLNTWYFLSYSGTYDQIKSSGSLRYFPDSISEVLTFYEQSIKQNTLSQNIEMDNMTGTIKPFLYNNINYKYVHLVSMNEPVNEKVDFIKSDPFVREHLYAFAGWCYERNRFLTAEYTNLKEQSVNIIRLLKKQYKL